MKYFPNVPNLNINADNFLDGFLGLRWLPSDHAKRQVADYERKVGNLLFRLWGKYTSGWVMYEIGRARPKQVDIKPSQFGPDYFPKDKNNAFTGPKDRDDWPDAMKRGTEGKTCLPETKKDDVPGTGQGVDVIISFDPDQFATSEGPGSLADEILLHELVHAMRDVGGKGTRCFGAPRGFNSDYEEFVAVVIANVYNSELGRPLRKNLEGYQPLQPELCSSQAFFDKFQQYLLPLRDVHQHLYTALKKATGIPFNPFTLM
jgi:hypothetical protein